MHGYLEDRQLFTHKSSHPNKTQKAPKKSHFSFTDSRQSRSKQNSTGGGAGSSTGGGLRKPTPSTGSTATSAAAAAAALAAAEHDKERKIGHRRVNETGEVSYKKVSTNHLMGSLQLGIGHAIGTLSKHDDRDLLMQDFMTVETTQFPKSGSSQTPAHSYSEFTFRTYAPLAFRYFLNLFGIRR